ncbi:MAG: hypothetical protein FWG50_02105 [Kiritimatiellaeota bacterium]|nr:hypothetical protein [Kiritimatiellota bacterium]
MLAIGLGLVGLFGLGRLALETSRETENDRRCAVMADAVFETLRAVNEVFIDEARTNGFKHAAPPSAVWNDLWEQGGQGQRPQLPEALPNALWHPDGYLLFPPVANMTTNDIPLLYETGDFSWDALNLVTAYHPEHISLVNWNPLYYLNIREAFDYRYYSPIAGTYSVKQITLVIYPDGKVGSSDPRIFTVILSNVGGMQSPFDPPRPWTDEASSGEGGEP